MANGSSGNERFFVDGLVCMNSAAPARRAERAIRHDQLFAGESLARFHEPDKGGVIQMYLSI
eukprot:scaffold322301_cov32-Tisochrysis_lutea.AAC.2